MWMPRRKDCTDRPRGVAGAAAGGQDVVGAGRVVAERDRRPRADEDRAGVAHPVGDGRRVRGLDLQVLGGVRVDDRAGPRRRRRRARSRTAGRPSAGAIRSSTCLVAATCGSSSFSTASASSTESVTSTAAASGSCSAWLIRSAATCTGSAVSSARIAISVGPASASMPMRPLKQPLGGGDPDVAGAGDHVGGRALLGAVREHRDGLGAAGRVHLVDAEQRAGGEDRRVRQPAEVAPAAGEARAMRLDARLLRGHHVHDHGGRVDGPAAGRVQPDPVDRHPPLGDRAAGHDLGGVRRCGAARGGRAGRAGWTPPGPRARPGRARSQRRRRAPAAGTRTRFQPHAVELLARSRSAPRRPDDARPRRSAAPSPGRPRRRSRLGAAGRAGRVPRGGRRRADRFGRSRGQFSQTSSGAVRAYQWLIQVRPASRTRKITVTSGVQSGYSAGITVVRTVTGNGEEWENGVTEGAGIDGGSAAGTCRTT